MTREEKDTPTIVDVRMPDEYLGQHLRGAINIPLNEVAGRLAEFKAMTPPIYLYCRSGARSRAAAALLKKSGLPNIIDAGGLPDAIKLLNQ